MKLFRVGKIIKCMGFNEQYTFSFKMSWRFFCKPTLIAFLAVMFNVAFSCQLFNQSIRERALSEFD